jgi:hypothetical protein
VSVGIHYPNVFDGSSGTDKKILVIRQRTSLISNKDLIGLLGWLDMKSRDKLQKYRLRMGETSLGQNHER